MAQQENLEAQKIQPQDPQYTLEDHMVFKRNQQILNRALKQLFEQNLSEFELIMDGTTYAYTRLNLSNRGIKQINQLIWQYPHLRKLQLSFNLLQNVNSLMKLKYLVWLDLSKNSLVQAKFLSNQIVFPYLSNINLEGNKIQSLPPIQLANLRNLNLNYNAINNLEDFEGHKKLTKIQLKGNKINSLKGLKKLPQLKQLDISQNLLENFTGLQQAPKLDKIFANKNKIKALDSFPQLPALKFLSLVGNMIAKVEDVKGICPSVTNLNVLQNPISQQLGDNTKKQIFMKFRQYEIINEIPIQASQKQQFDKQYKQRLAEQQRERLQRQAAQRQAAQQQKQQ